MGVFFRETQGERVMNDEHQKQHARWGALLLLLAGLAAVPVAPAQDLNWQPFEEALAVADSTDRPVLVDVYAPWCGWCRKMKRDVYPSDRVRSCLADGFVLTRLNRDDTETTHRYRGRRLDAKRLAQAFGAASVPTVVLLAPDGERLVRLPGFIEAKALQPVLAYVASGAYRRQTFEAFRASSSLATQSCTTPSGNASVERR